MRAIATNKKLLSIYNYTPKKWRSRVSFERAAICYWVPLAPVAVALRATRGHAKAATPVLRFQPAPGYNIRVPEFPRLPPRLRWIFAHNPLFFVTFCTYERRKLLASDPVHAAFVGFAEQAYWVRKIAVGRYVVMPDHVHLFVRGPDDFQLGPWVGMLKQLSRNILRWQGHRRSGSAGFLIMFSATMKAMETNGITFERIPFVLDLSTIQTSGGIQGKLW